MNKCQCAVPDYIKIPGDGGFTNTVLLKGFGTVLHGKKATTKCERCGIPLCDDCCEFGVKIGNWDITFPLCSTCWEVQ